MKTQLHIPPLSDSDIRRLEKQISKDASNLSVKHGRTNGVNVLHIHEPGFRDADTELTSQTIKSFAEWEADPRNERTNRKRTEERETPEELQITHVSKEST